MSPNIYGRQGYRLLSFIVVIAHALSQSVHVGRDILAQDAGRRGSAVPVVCHATAVAGLGAAAPVVCHASAVAGEKARTLPPEGMWRAVARRAVPHTSSSLRARRRVAISMALT